MMAARQLLLMRQGASRPGEGNGLLNKAKRRAQRMGIWIARNQLMPDAIICSSDPCAIVTTSKLSKAMEFSARDIIVDTDPIHALKQLPPYRQRVLIVGDAADLQPLMASRVAIHHGDLIQLGQRGEVAQYIKAKSLPKGFPYPDIHHSAGELRSRPAYYYRQSSVIPYRLAGKGIEILLVSSSSGRHWVVPKGIHEPGMSAAASAAREAQEEAGVVGRVADSPLGSYRYTKWKSACEVTVFAMQVTRELPEQEWQESYRGRRWCTPEKAMAMLHQPQLAPLIQQMVRSV